MSYLSGHAHSNSHVASSMGVRWMSKKIFWVPYHVSCTECKRQGNDFELITTATRRPASPDRTARRQFQATGQPVSRTQASDAMTSRLPRYQAKCVQRRCFQCGSVPLRSDIKGTELPPTSIVIPLERQLIALQQCGWEFLYNEILQQTFRPVLSKLPKRRQIE